MRISRIVIGLLLVCTLAFQVSAVIVERIAVRVNDDIITMYQIRTKAEQIKSEYRQLRRRVPGNLYKYAREQLIDEILVMQKAKKEGVLVNRLEIEDRISKLIKARNLTLKQFKQMLAKEGGSYKLFYERMKVKLTLQKLFNKVQRDREKSLTPSDKELLQHYRTMTLEEYRIWHLFIYLSPRAKFSTRQAIETRIEKVRAALKQNRWKMPAIARYNRAQFKDFGYVQPNPKLPKYLFPIFSGKLWVGKYKEFRIVNELPRYPGFHAIMVAGKRKIPFEKAKALVRNSLYEKKMGDAVERWVQTLRKDADIDIR